MLISVAIHNRVYFTSDSSFTVWKAHLRLLQKVLLCHLAYWIEVGANVLFSHSYQLSSSGGRLQTWQAINSNKVFRKGLLQANASSITSTPNTQTDIALTSSLADSSKADAAAAVVCHYREDNKPLNRSCQPCKGKGLLFTHQSSRNISWPAATCFTKGSQTGAATATRNLTFHVRANSSCWMRAGDSMLARHRGGDAISRQTIPKQPPPRATSICREARHGTHDHWGRRQAEGGDVSPGHR